MRVAYYVSGHGYGHAVRAAEVARVLARRGATVVIRSDAPAEAFGPLPIGVELESVAVDVGVIQHDAVTVDEAETLRRFESFWSTIDDRVEFEATRLHVGNFDVVVADVAPLGIVAAERAGLPSILVANFTWDGIYEAWSDREPTAAALAGICRDAYARASLAVVTAPDCGVARAQRREDVGLIVRAAQRPRDDTRAELGIEPGDVAVLVAFGGFGPPELAPPTASGESRIRYVGFSPLPWPDHVYQRVDRGRYSHPDLVAAVDVLFGKPGYGTVAECAAHGTRMLWVDRERFAETPGLVRAIIDHVGGAPLDAADMRAGRLHEAIATARSTPPRRGPLATDGAEATAECIVSAARLA